MVTPRSQVCLNSSMLGASLPSTFWEPPVLFKVLFLRLEWQVRLQPKAISWSTCYQYFILVSLLTDQTYGLVASHHSLLKCHPRNQCLSKFRQSIATKKVESLEQVKKKGEIILSMLSLESHYASLSVSFFRSRKKRAGTKRLPLNSENKPLHV